MEQTQLILTIALIIIELVAFAWLIIDIRKSKKKQDIILELEKQILNMEESIMDLEQNIIQQIKELREILDKKLGKKYLICFFLFSDISSNASKILSVISSYDIISKFSFINLSKSENSELDLKSVIRSCPSDFKTLLTSKRNLLKFG